MQGEERPSLEWQNNLVLAHGFELRYSKEGGKARAFFLRIRWQF